MDEEAAITGHVTRSKQMLAGMFDQGTAILSGMAGNRQRIKVSSQTVRWQEWKNPSRKSFSNQLSTAFDRLGLC